MTAARKDYIPRPDGTFDAWTTHYVAAVHAWWLAHGLDENDLKPLDIAAGEWQKAYPTHVTAQAAAEGARQGKDAARAGLEKQVRPITNFIQTYFKTTDADRATMGITVRGSPALRAGSPKTAPLATVDSPARLTHQLRLVDESTPTRRARPAGVLGAEVWVKLVDADSPAPTDPAALTFLTMTTKPSFRAEFKAGEGGKTAVYMARWVNTRGEKGPWSEITTATVAA